MYKSFDNDLNIAVNLIFKQISEKKRDKLIEKRTSRCYFSFCLDFFKKNQLFLPQIFKILK